jgi:hypothetical protein
MQHAPFTNAVEKAFPALHGKRKRPKASAAFDLTLLQWRAQ